jgi:hypothetical protein
MLYLQKSLRPLQDDSSLIQWHDNYAVAVDNNDVPWQYRHPGTLDRNVDVPIARDRACVGNNSFAYHGKPHPSDLFDISTGTIDHRCNHSAIERRHRHVLAPEGGV